ncbi:MAG: hypothetical protein ACJAXR_000756 [Halopseudomonas sp.]
MGAKRQGNFARGVHAARRRHRLPIGGDYSTDTIRVELICENQDVL